MPLARWGTVFARMAPPTLLDKTSRNSFSPIRRVRFNFSHEPPSDRVGGRGPCSLIAMQDDFTASTSPRVGEWLLLDYFWVFLLVRRADAGADFSPPPLPSLGRGDKGVTSGGRGGSGTWRLVVTALRLWSRRIISSAYISSVLASIAFCSSRGNCAIRSLTLTAIVTILPDDLS